MKTHNIVLFLKQNTYFSNRFDVTCVLFCWEYCIYEIRRNMKTVIFVLTFDSCHIYAHLKNRYLQRKMCAFRTYSSIILVKFQFILLFILISTICDSATGTKQSIRSVDVEKTKVWGPGLEPDKIVLPVRHFYIQAIDAFGNS